MKISNVSFLLALLGSAYTAQAVVIVGDTSILGSDELDFSTPIKACQPSSRETPETLKDIEPPKPREKTISGRSFHDPVKKLIGENFQDTKCTTSLLNTEAVREKFNHLISYFPKNMELRLSYARFLLSINGSDETLSKSITEGLNEFSKVVRSGGATPDTLTEFISWIRKIGDTEPYILQVSGITINPFAHINIGDIKDQASKEGQKKIQQKIKSLLVENVVLLFDNLKLADDKTMYDATMMVILGMIENATNSIVQKMYNEVQTSIVCRLYNENPDKASPFVKRMYSDFYLTENKKYHAASVVYESILGINSKGTDSKPDEFYQTSSNYNTLLSLYHVSPGFYKKTIDQDGLEIYEYPSDNLKKVEKSVALWKDAMDRENSNDLNSNDLFCINTLFRLHMMSKQYPEALNLVKMGLNKNIENSAERSIHKVFQKAYKFLLQSTGNEDELTAILCNEQKALFEKDEKIAKLIKAAQAQHQEVLEKAQHIKKEGEKVQAELLKQRKQTLAVVATGKDSSLESPYANGHNKNASESEPIAPKEKQKTHRPSHQESAGAIVQPPSKKSLLSIRDITQNKQAWKTFEDLFSSYRPGIKSDGNVQISLNRIEAFFEALNPKSYDASEGKGSHKKVTLNFGDDMEEHVFTLTNVTHLKPEQIKSLRRGFLEMRIVPDLDDSKLIKRLEAEGLL